MSVLSVSPSYVRCEKLYIYRMRGKEQVQLLPGDPVQLKEFNYIASYEACRAERTLKS